MIRINLLPYRAARRQSQILQHLGVAAAAVLLAVLICLTAHWMASSQLSDLNEEFAQLKAENAVLQKKIGKIKNLDKLRADVMSKLKLVDELQHGRFRSLLTLNGIATTIPENVWLTSISDTGKQIKLAGLGESNAAVANFMRSLEASELFSNVRLQVISRQVQSGSTVRSFSLTCNRDEQLNEKTQGKGVKGGSKS